jgi:hypothetical protein
MPKALVHFIATALSVLGAAAQVGQLQGRVRDADGGPIAGARVAIDVRYGQSPFRGTCEAFLRNHPLTDVRTTRDGSYVLLVPPEHTEIAALGLDWWFVVEAAGYQPWRERLRNGLSSDRADVCLLQAAVEDYVELRLDARAAPEDWLGGVLLSRTNGESLVVELDAEGRARALLPRHPWPLQPSFAPLDLTWRAKAKIARPVHVLPPNAAPGTPLQRADGAPAAAGRALIWNGIDCRLVALPQARVHLGPHVLAVGAKDCRWSTTARLEPLPATPPRRLRVVDAEGRPIAARALLLAATDWRPAHTRTSEARPGGRALWRRPRKVDRDGVLELGELPADDPTVLLVSAPGFASHTELDPRGCAEGASITLQRRAGQSVVVAARDLDGNPLAGARVYVDDLADAGYHAFGEPLLTGADGTVAIEGLSPIPHTVHVVADGFAPRTDNLLMKGEPMAIHPVALHRSSPSTWQLRTKDGDRPAAFATVIALHNDRGGVVNLPGNPGAHWQADARGELRLPHWSDVMLQHDDEMVLLAPPTAGKRTAWVRGVTPLLVTASPGLQLREVRDGRTSMNGPTEAMLAFVPDGRTCDVGLLPAGRVSLAPEQLAKLPRDAATGLRRWRVDPTRVSIALAGDCPAPERWIGVRLAEPCELGLDSIVLFRDDLGQWRLTDSNVADLCCVHPQHPTQRLTLTSRQSSGEQPIRWRAAAGSPLSVDLARGGIGAANIVVTVASATDAAHPQLVFRSGLLLAKDTPVPSNRGQRCPVEFTALAPGRWTVRMQGTLLTADNSGPTFDVTREVDADGKTAIALAPRD